MAVADRYWCPVCKHRYCVPSLAQDCLNRHGEH